jgi:purine nucleosidase
MRRVIIDTDIGTDVDDAWAISLAMASPEISIEGITLVHGFLDIRERVLRRLIYLANRNIPVARGSGDPMTPGYPIYWNGRETDYVKVNMREVPRYGAHYESALHMFSKTTEIDPVDVLAIGPLTNVADWVSYVPDLHKCISKLYIMGASFTRWGVPVKEHNVRLDPMATKIVYERTEIPIVSVGLNVTKKVAVAYQQVADNMSSEYMEFLGGMTLSYMSTNYGAFTYMHDPLALATIIDPTVCDYIRGVRAEVGDNGYVKFINEPGNIDIAIDVDVNKFNSILNRVFKTFS